MKPENFKSLRRITKVNKIVIAFLFGITIFGGITQTAEELWLPNFFVTFFAFIGCLLCIEKVLKSESEQDKIK